MVKITAEGENRKDIIKALGGITEKTKIPSKLIPVLDVFKQIINGLKAATERKPVGKSRKMIARLSGNKALELYEEDAFLFGEILRTLEYFGIAKRTKNRWGIERTEKN